MDLGLNIDHIATLREARKTNQPDPLEAVFIAKNCGVNQITIHLREDRRHIHDSDVARIIQSSILPVNVECACDEGVIEYLCRLKPFKVTLVPEKREEVTTEGGLNMYTKGLKEVIQELSKNEILVATFIDANRESIELSKQFKAYGVELHTGSYANIFAMLYSCLALSHNAIQELMLPKKELQAMLHKALGELEICAKESYELDLGVFAGHGLNYENVALITKIPHITELNIGHSIIARAVIVGLERAISDMHKVLI